ncbi:MAG: vWA domain-containing protein [Polyangiaceae bacterium]
MGSVGLASVRRAANASRVEGVGAVGVCLWLLSACSTSPTGDRGGNGGSSNLSGGSSAVSGGTSSANGGASNGGSSVASGGSTQGNGGTSSASGGASSGGSTNSNAGTGTASGGTSSASGGATGTAGACQMANYNFEPKQPTVYVMVDRSGSMFDCLSTTTTTEPSCTTPDDTAWVKLKTAALTVIQSLQADVRFGFASFTGTNPNSGGTCPQIDQVAPALNNYAAIQTLYNSLAFQPNTTQSGQKFETPARQALDLIGAKLVADTAPGDKYVLFVTDGQPDYCDDANSLCAPDSVIAGLQLLKTKNITTIVMGLQSTANDLAPGILQGFANAGRGETTVAPLKANLDKFAFYDQCNSVAGWHADLLTSGKTAERGVTLGNYSDMAGPTKPYTPNSADQAMIVSQLSTALAGVKSCSFDLSNVNGQSIKVDMNNLKAASVAIEGKTVAQDASNGWSMASASQLVLNGSACESWRLPTNNKIDFNFPCDTIIFE